MSSVGELATAAVRAALRIEADALAALADRCDTEAITRAAEVLATASLVTMSASGSSGFAAAKFAHSLCCIE
ncbi:MAG: hypothetical protein LBH76_09470, partial [Propionibacteriaceae bacterium]|nr:hypothetical protein [Propionibacteriaceae bacterium]